MSNSNSIRPKPLTFWNQEIEKDSLWMLQNLSSTCFTLAGFSLAGLSLVIGLFKDDLARASVVVSGFLVSMALYMWAGEMAREAYRLVKYAFAETIHMFTSIILSASVLYFVIVQPKLAIDQRILFIMALPIAFFTWRVIHNIALITKIWFRMRRQSKEPPEDNAPPVVPQPPVVPTTTPSPDSGAEKKTEPPPTTSP